MLYQDKAPTVLHYAYKYLHLLDKITLYKAEMTQILIELPRQLPYCTLKCQLLLIPHGQAVSSEDSTYTIYKEHTFLDL